MFWVAPIIGAVIGGLLYRFVLEVPDETIDSGDTGIAIEASGPQNEGQLRLRRQSRQTTPEK